MNDLERRIQDSRPRGPGRGSPLSRRAQADFEAITGHAYERRRQRPETRRSPLERSARARLLMPAAAAVAIALAVGSFAVSQIGRPTQDDGDAESITGDSYQLAGQSAAAQPYEDLRALAQAADLVVVVEVPARDGTERTDGTAINPDGITVAEVDEVLMPAQLDLSTVQVVEDPVDSGGQSALAAVAGAKAVLFLNASGEPGVYTLTHPTQGVLGVDGGEVRPVLAAVDMGGVETVAQLRSLLDDQ